MVAKIKSIPVGAPHPWPLPSSPSSSSPLPSPYGDAKSYRGNCVQGICSFSCPEWCGGTLYLPPPPPFLLDSPDGGGGDGDGGRISPLMAALIAVLAAAFLLLFYYTVVSRFCRRRRRRRLHHRQIDDDALADARIDSMVQDPTRPAAASGLDDSFIHQITVFKYRRSDGLIDGTDCAVCLSDFKEEENLRLMPNCEHAFHIPCIDTWLKTHSNCPLCRATMNPTPPARTGSNPGDPNLNRNGGGVSVAAMQMQRSNDAVLVIREEEGDVIVCHEVVVEEGEERENGEQHKPAI